MQILGHKNVRKMEKNAIFGGGGSQGHLRAQDLREKETRPRDLEIRRSRRGRNLGITEHRNSEGEAMQEQETRS